MDVTIVTTSCEIVITNFSFCVSNYGSLHHVSITDDNGIEPFHHKSPNTPPDSIRHDAVSSCYLIASMIITEIPESNGSKDIPIISAIDNVTVILRSPLHLIVNPLQYVP